MNDDVRIEVLDCIELVKILYDSENGSVGGYGHIVFDDGNLEIDCIKSCLEDAKQEKYNNWICEDTRIKSIYALEKMLLLNYVERNFVYNNY